MIKTILAAINLAISAVRGAFAIKGVIESEGTIPEKIAAVSEELSAVTTKLQALSKETAATWDDSFADALKDILDAIATNVIEELGAA